MEDKQQLHNQPNHTHNHNNPSVTVTATKEESPRKPLTVGGGDRLKRDEWSEGAVSTLLEAYEAKWVLRNRAKLKGHDWEDVARYVSSRADSTKSPKTQTQCKNKIESMKKRYRSESAGGGGDNSSSWPLYSRLDLLLRGTGSPASNAPPSNPSVSATAAPAPLVPVVSQSPSPHLGSSQGLVLLEPPLAVVSEPHPSHQPPPAIATATATVAVAMAAAAAPPARLNEQNSHGSNGVDKLVKVILIIKYFRGINEFFGVNLSNSFSALPFYELI